MLSSTRTITTDLRHIDPNPDRLQLVSAPSTSQSPLAKPNSLLLLSTSAEAAVAESKRFERRSRHSSLCTASSPPNSILNSTHKSPYSIGTTTHTNTTTTTTTATPTQQRTTPATQPTHSTSPSSISSASFGPYHVRNLSQSPLRYSRPFQQGLPRPLTLQNTSLPNIHNSNNTSFINRRDQSKPNHLFKCEKCLKVYRHPQCLVKHRWEHTEYWADASKLMLSKHQQVQMLEAAAILVAPSGSLPESRSLWPAAVSSSEAGLLGSDRVNLEVICSQRAASKNLNQHTHYHRHSSSASCAIGRRSSAATDVEMSEETESRRSIDEDGEDNVQVVGEDDDEDQIMFEMSLDGEENTPPNGIPNLTDKPRNDSRLSMSSKLSNSSVSGPPSFGYFERRNPESVSSVISDFEQNPNQPSPRSSSRSKSRNLATCLPATIAYQPPKLNNNHMTKDQLHHQTIGFAYHSSESIFKPIAPYQDSQLRFETPHRFLVNNHEDTAEPDLAKHSPSFNLTPHDDDTEDDDDDDAWSRPVEPEREREGDEVVGMEL